MSASKVMLVTGGTGSIGEAVVREARAQGWAVIAHGNTPAKVVALIDELGIEGFAADVAGEDGAARIVTEAIGKFGRIDAIVDCVSNGPRGARLTGHFKDTDASQFGTYYDLSAAWFQRLAHAAYPHLQQSRGTIIGFVSDAGRFAAPRQSIVGAARAATIGFIRNLAIEAAHDGIRANCISTSYVLESASAIRMGQSRAETAAKRAGLGLPKAGDIAPLTVFLCGDGAAKITGQVISVNGGLNA